MKLFSMQWFNEVIMEPLELYEAEPLIWNPKNADHRDRNKIMLGHMLLPRHRWASLSHFCH